MAPFLNVVLTGLLVVAAHAQVSDPCPYGQNIIANNKCCPGVQMNDTSVYFCCILGAKGDCGSNICIDGSTCKAKVSVNDPDYNQKVGDASSGSRSQSSQSSSSASSTESATSSATADSSTITGSASAIVSSAIDSIPSTTESSIIQSAVPTGAAGVNQPMLGMIAGLIAMIAWYDM